MPDLETLGGALFGALLQLLVDKLDSPQLLHYFRGKKLDELLKNLRSKLVSINTVIDDAEQNQFRSPYVKAWHDEVRDVLLDTEDLLDEIDYEFSKTELKAEYQSSASKGSSEHIRRSTNWKFLRHQFSYAYIFIREHGKW